MSIPFAFRRATAALAAIAAVTPLPAQQADASRLTIDRIFASRDFAAEFFGPSAWLPDGRGYTTLEPSRDASAGADLVRYDAATGARDVLVPAARFVPPGATAPLEPEDYVWSPDQKRLLVFTNSARVWRDNTRGDYWVLDLNAGALRKLGGADGHQRARRNLVHALINHNDFVTIR